MIILPERGKSDTDGAPGRSIGRFVVVVGCLAAAGLEVWAEAAGGGAWLRPAYAALTAAILAGVLIRLRSPAVAPPAAAVVFVLVLALGAANPRTASAVLGLGRAGLFGLLMLVFGRSLLPGRTALATQLAQSLDATLTDDRLRYTRIVTWMWLFYFAGECAVSLGLAACPASASLRIMSRLALPMAGLLLAAELAWRGWRFRGQAHGSAADMLRAFSDGAFPGVSGRPKR